MKALKVESNTGWFNRIINYGISFSNINYPMRYYPWDRSYALKNIESVVSLRPWIKDSSCLHWIVLNHYKVSDGFCLDTFSNPSLSGRNLLGKFMVFQKFQDSPFTGDFPFVQTKRAYWNSSLINVDVSECKGRASYWGIQKGKPSFNYCTCIF